MTSFYTSARGSGACKFRTAPIFLIRRQLGTYDGAPSMGRIEQLEQFVAQRPDDPFPRYGLALELKNAGRLDDADRQFAELMTRFPDYTAAYLHAGNVKRALHQRDEAASIYEKGIEACARKGDAHARGELEAALAALQDGSGEDDGDVQP